MRPILCNYYVTTRCNGRCTFCNIPYQNDSADADIGDVIPNLKHLRQVGVRFVDFTGGEPLLFQPLGRALREARVLGFITSVTTNTILYPERASEIRGLVSFLHFSLDGPDPETNDSIRGPSSFAGVMRALETALNLGERPDLLFTATAENLDTLPRMANMASQLRLMLIINPAFSYFRNVGLSREHVPILRQYLGKPFVYINRAQLDLLEAGGNDPENPQCRAVNATIVISPDNHLLTPCFHHAQSKIPIEGRLREILRSDALIKKRCQDGTHSFCRGCTIGCYFDPSFHYQFDRYLAKSLYSKAEYVFWKHLYPLFLFSHKSSKANEIAHKCRVHAA